MEHIGEIAAFGTAICWTVCAMFFEVATRKVGAIAVNSLKVLIASVLLSITAGIIYGKPFPVDAPLEAWIYLTISGIIGLVFTDLFLFNAYSLISSRVATLCLALSPPITAVIGYFFLGEKMGHLALIGMCIVVIGIIITVLGRMEKKHFSMTKTEKKGYIYALIACIGQSIGLVLSKKGVAHYNAISGTQIRAMAATVGFIIITFLYDKGKSVNIAVHDKVSRKQIIIGSILGPFIGVTLSTFASQMAYTGVVSSIVGMTPVLIILPSILVFKQKVKVLEIIGAIIAVSGTVIFFL